MLFTLSPALTIYLLFLALLLGLVVGSFCNAWAWRLAHGESIARGRSHCAQCGHTLAARDLIPLFSFLFLKGRCRYCGVRIGARYPAAEAICAAFFVSVLLRFGLDDPFATLRLLLAGSLLLTLSLTDLESMEIPDRLTVSLAAIFLLRFFSEGWQGLADGLLGALLVPLSLFFLVLFAEKLTGKEMMGGGDLKLLFALGLHFGPALTLMLLIFACVCGLIFGLLAGAARKKNSPSRPIPFGPSIAAAAWAVALFGSPLLYWYTGLFLSVV